MKKKLHHSGAPPFGYKPMKDAYVIDGRPYDGWVPDDSSDGSISGLSISQRFLWIIDRFIECENAIQIALELSELGVPTPRLVQWNRLSKSEQARRLEIQQKNRDAGHSTMQLPPSPVWDSSVISDMLRSRTYLGMIAYTPEHLQTQGQKKAKSWYEGRHEPLLTQDKFEQVQAILERKGQDKRSPVTKRSDVLLNGMLICTCGYAMTFNAKDKHGHKVRYLCNLRRKTRGGVSSDSKY
ncbi:Recombinase [compost metagenome]